MDVEDLYCYGGEDNSDCDRDMINADSNCGICDPDDDERECLDLIGLKRYLSGCTRSLFIWSSWVALPHRLCSCRRYLERAKALDPDIVTDAAFRLANEDLEEQEMEFYQCLASFEDDCGEFCEYLEIVMPPTVVFYLEKLHSSNIVLTHFLH